MKRMIALFAAVMVCISAGLAVNAEGDDVLVLSNCDTTEFWSANSQGMDALESDAVNKTEGSGSVGATAINGKLNQIAFIPAEPMDVSAYSYLEFDIYFNDITWFNDCGSVMIELTSSGTSDRESNRYMKQVMRHLFETGAVKDQTNWWHFVLDLNNPQGTANGQFDKSKFNFFRFYTVDPISTTPDYTVRIDNMQFTNHPTNYQPMVTDDEDATNPGKAEVYVPLRSDPNLKLTEQLKIVMIVEIAAVALIFAAVVFVLIRIILKGKRKGAKS